MVERAPWEPWACASIATPGGGAGLARGLDDERRSGRAPGGPRAVGIAGVGLADRHVGIAREAIGAQAQRLHLPVARGGAGGGDPYRDAAAAKRHDELGLEHA